MGSWRTSARPRGGRSSTLASARDLATLPTGRTVAISGLVTVGEGTFVHRAHEFR